MIVGQECQFYYCGWRYGRVLALPIKGKHKGKARVETAVDLRGQDGKIKPRAKMWVSVHDVNEVGDTVYHGPKLREIVEERAEAKEAEQKKADKKTRRFRNRA